MSTQYSFAGFRSSRWFFDRECILICVARRMSFHRLQLWIGFLTRSRRHAVVQCTDRSVYHIKAPTRSLSRCHIYSSNWVTYRQESVHVRALYCGLKGLGYALEKIAQISTCTCTYMYVHYVHTYMHDALVSRRRITHHCPLM